MLEPGKSTPGVPPAQALVPGLTVLAHPDPQRVGERALLDGLAPGRALDLSRHAPEFSQPGAAQRHPLLDAHLSREPLRLRRDSAAGAHDGCLDSCRSAASVGARTDHDS